MSILRSFQDSAKEFKNIRSIVITALFIAIAIVLNTVLRIDVTQYKTRVTFGFLCIGTIGMLFGPAMAMIAGFVTDFLAASIFPMGPYFPGHALTAILEGMIWGVFLYQREYKIWRIILARTLISVFCYMFLNTLWQTILNDGAAFFALLPIRVIKNLIMLPIEILLFFLLGTKLRSMYKPQISNGRGSSE